jgi:plastocyanin
MTARVLLLASLVAVLAPSAAAADTFCVADTSCPVDHRYSTIGAAVSAAGGNGANTVDTVRVGAGTYHEAVTALSSNPIQLIGAGRSQTIIDGTGATSQVLVELRSPQSVASNLGVHMRANTDTGFHVIGATVRASVVQGDAAAADTIGFDGENGATFESDQATSAASSGRGFHTSGTGTATIKDSSATADQPFFLEGSTTAQRIAATGLSSGIAVKNASATVDDALVVVDHDDGAGVLVFTSGDVASAQLRLHGATVHMSGTSTFALASSSGDANSATLHADNVIVDGGSIALAELGLIGSGPSHVDATYSDFDPDLTSPSGIGTGTGNVNVDPRLVDAPHGDFRLRADSPVIDAGSSPLGNNESTTDKLGNPRVVDGDGDALAIRDMGAFEFQPTAPIASASADRATASVGDTVTFTGSSTDADAGDTAAYTWSCDDGATGTGTSLAHSFAATGTHSCAVTARDRAGKTGSASAIVTVTEPAPPHAGGGSPATSPPPPPPPPSPWISFALSPKTVKLSKKGTFTWTFGATSGVSGRATFLRGHTSLGKASFTVPPNGRATVTVKLSKKSVMTLRKLKKARVSAHVAVGSRDYATTFTLRARR